MRNGSLIKRHIENLRDEASYLRLILRGGDIPGMIMLVIQLAIDIGFATGSDIAGIFGTTYGFFFSMNAVILCFYFWSKREYNENFLLYRMLLRIAVIALLIRIAQTFLFA